LTLNGEIVAGQAHYQRFSLDNTTHSLDVTVPPAATPGTPNALAVAVQLDGNATASPYAMFLDQVGLITQCPTIYDPGNGWLIDMCDAPVSAPMTVIVDGVTQGRAGMARIYHQSQSWPGLPQVAVIYASGFVRLKQNADPVSPIPFGPSFALGPAYWSGSDYYHNPQLNRLDINTAWLPNGPLRLHAEGTNQDFAVSYEMALPPPRDRQTRLHVTQTYTATAAMTIPLTRTAAHEGFKLVQISSMFINQGSTCDGGQSDCHDSNAARFIGSDLMRHQVAFTQITPSAFIFSNTIPLGSTWLEALHTDDQGWQGDTPNVRIVLDALPLTTTVTPQGRISATTDPNQDNVDLWLHDDDPAAQSWTPGQRGQIGYWLLAQDNPPKPWADLGLRSGFTFQDFEGSYTCFPVLPILPVTGTVMPIAGYSDTALQLSYNLGSGNGNWAQVRCNFDPPLDLSAHDHLRLDWRSDPASGNSLQVGLINPGAGVGQEYIFARGYHHVTQHGWWGQLVIPFSFLDAWTTGTTFDPSQVSAIFISVVKDPVDDIGGVGSVAIDNLNAYNVLSRTIPLTFETVINNTTASAAAVQWLVSQQQPSGLLKSWEEEPGCVAHTYDLALALLVFPNERLWPQADALVNALISIQETDGSWYQTNDCVTLVGSGNKWEGDIAWAIYALSRYRALGGTLPGAQTAMLKGAAWLNMRIAPSDGPYTGCLVIDHTEATIDTWWAFQSAGPAYTIQAQGIRNCLLTHYWDNTMGRFKGGRDWWQPYLDNQTWGAAFLKAIGEDLKARRALSYANATLMLPAQGGQLFGFDGQAGPWSVWNEGAGQYGAVGGEGANDLLAELLAQQRPDGAMPGSPDDFRGGGVWTTRWHGVAPTAWLYDALNGEPFHATVLCRIYLPLVRK